MSLVIFGRGQEAAGRTPRPNIVSIAILGACIVIGALTMQALGNAAPLVVMAVVGLTLMQSPRIAEQWERAVILRLGRFSVCAVRDCSGSCLLSIVFRAGSINARLPPRLPPSKR